MSGMEDEQINTAAISHEKPIITSIKIVSKQADIMTEEMVIIEF
jgi:hypothetical protein